MVLKFGASHQLLMDAEVSRYSGFWSSIVSGTHRASRISAPNALATLLNHTTMDSIDRHYFVSLVTVRNIGLQRQQYQVGVISKRTLFTQEDF